MKKTNIFIDTSIFISSNYNLNSKVFTSLKALCNSGHVKLILTDITIEEIKSNLLKSIKESQGAIKKARTQAKVLWNLQSDAYKFLFAKLNQDNIYKRLFEQVTIYFQECNATIINATEISAKQIFQDYFKCEPPFGEGKKKSEFPDAFVVSAICEWCSKNDDKVFIVSEDPDFKNASMQNSCLEHLPSVAKFIELILADENILVGVIHKHISQQKEKLFKSIANQIKEYDMIVQDADFDAEAFVADVSITEIYDESIVYVADNKATIELNVLANLSVDVNCYDPDSWYKDPEDKSIHYWDKIEDIFERELDVEVEIDIEFDKTAIEDFEVTNVLVNKGNLLSFYLKEDDDY